jgi:hypothetical protein
MAPTKGLALLIKVPDIARSFIPGEGETITILDKNGKEVWSIEVPAPTNNPGVTISRVCAEAARMPQVILASSELAAFQPVNCSE